MNGTDAQAALFGKWEKIVTQRGKIDERTRSGVLFLTGFYAYIKSKWICISVLEKREDNFFLSLYIDEPEPIPSLPQNSWPPRKIVTDFPSDCRLDYLRDYGAVFVAFTPIEVKENNFICQFNLIITSGNGYKFKIEPSEEVWGCLEISMISP